MPINVVDILFSYFIRNCLLTFISMLLQSMGGLEERKKDLKKEREREKKKKMNE